MKQISFLLCVFLCMPLFADQQAVTDKGEVVILKEDGTWVFVNDQQTTADDPITTNSTKFTKSEASSFQLKSVRNKSSFWINPKKWTFIKSDEDAEYNFELKGKDLYGMAITEEISIPMDTLADIALENFNSVSSNGRFQKREFRMVNGHKVMYVEIVGTIDGVNVQYSSYYYSDSSGSTQYITYTAPNLIEKYGNDIEEFLNGFDVQ